MNVLKKMHFFNNFPMGKYKKLDQIAWILLIVTTALAILHNAFATEGGISLNSTYNVGSTVVIEINEKYFTNDILLEITSKDFVYRFIDILSKSIKFIPTKSGNYSISLINKSNNDVIESFSLGVEGKEEIEERNKDLGPKEKEIYIPRKREICNITTNKKEYLMGEGVIIYASIEEGDGIYITSENESYYYIGHINQSLKFIPKNIGSHTIEVTDSKGDKVCGSDFIVINNTNKPLGIIPNTSRKAPDFGKDEKLSKIVLKDSKSKVIKFNAKRIKMNEEKKKTTSYQIQSEAGIQPKEEMVEIVPENMPIKSIRFNNLELEANTNLGLDNTPEKIKKINDKDVVEIYAIDPSNLNFSDAIVTAKAKGSELYKCKEWNFSEQKCYGNWEKIMNLIPGQEYNFALTKQDPGFGETSPPQPHNIQGRVFNSDGVTGVNNGIPVTINDTISGDFVLTYTYAPDIPSIRGSYSAAINGSNGDTIIVTAWNSTYYGTNTTTLASTTTYINVVLNTTRPSETNVTIIPPANNSVKNTSYPFNVTANIAIIGGESGINCNATISFSYNSILNISSEENFTHNLEGISLGSYKTTTWNVTAIGEGVSNLSVQAECANQTKNFYNVNIDYVYDITTADTSPPIINLISPENNSLVRRNAGFFYNVSDHSAVSNCSLIVNGAVRANDTSIEKDTIQSYQLQKNKQDILMQAIWT